jgi:hypothetical protein
MSETYSVQSALSRNSIPVWTSPMSITDDADETLDTVVTDPGTDVEYDFVCPKTGLTLFALEVDQACTVKTNSTTVPGNTFTFGVGGGSFVWSTSSSITDPLAADITKLYVTTSGKNVHIIASRLFHLGA